MVSRSLHNTKLNSLLFLIHDIVLLVQEFHIICNNNAHMTNKLILGRAWNFDHNIYSINQWRVTYMHLKFRWPNTFYALFSCLASLLLLQAKNTTSSDPHSHKVVMVMTVQNVVWMLVISPSLSLSATQAIISLMTQHWSFHQETTV